MPLASDTTVGPTTQIIFLGLTIDTVDQKNLVPPTKIVAILEELDAALNKSKLTLWELQSLLGSLNFFARLFGRAGHFCSVCVI